MSTIPRLAPAIAMVGLFLAGLTACDEKKKEPETSVEQRSTSDEFADKLVETEFVKYALGIGGGGRLVYETLEFKPNGTWVGDAELLLAEDPFKCTESGTWQLEEDGSGDGNVGRVYLVMNQTDCPGREADDKWKIEIRLEGKGGRPEIIDL